MIVTGCRSRVGEFALHILIVGGCLLLDGVTVNGQDEEGPSVTLDPPTYLTVEIGTSDNTCTCTPSNVSASVKWLDSRETEVSTNNSLRIYYYEDAESNRILVLNNAELNDTEDYTCVMAVYVHTSYTSRFSIDLMQRGFPPPPPPVGKTVKQCHKIGNKTNQLRDVRIEPRTSCDTLRKRDRRSITDHQSLFCKM